MTKTRLLFCIHLELNSFFYDTLEEKELKFQKYKNMKILVIMTCVLLNIDIGVSQSTLGVQKLLDLHNSYRKKANVKMLVWDDKLVKEAAKLESALLKTLKPKADLTVLSQDSSAFFDTNSLFSTPPKSPEVAAEVAFKSTYGESVAFYKYSSDKNITKCLQDRSQLDETDQKKLDFIRNTFYQDMTTIGCVMKKRSFFQTEFYLPICVYRSSGNIMDWSKSKPLFTEQSFIDICIAENAKWKACKADDQLNTDCRNGLGPQPITTTTTLPKPTKGPNGLFDYETRLVELHNEKRNLAGLSMLSWDDSLKKKAASWVGNICTAKSRFNDITQSWMAKTSSGASHTYLDASLAAEIFEFSYILGDRNFAGESETIYGCLNGQTPTTNQMTTISMIKNVFKDTATSFGCAYKDCKVVKVIGCQYDQSTNSNDQYFLNSNFLNMCSQEPHLWKSCNATLDAECKKQGATTVAAKTTTTTVAPAPKTTTTTVAPAPKTTTTTVAPAPKTTTTTIAPAPKTTTTTVAPAPKTTTTTVAPAPKTTTTTVAPAPKTTTTTAAPKTTTTTVAPPPVAPTPPPINSLTGFQQKMLDLHNTKRNLAGVRLFAWDVSMQRTAEQWLPRVCNSNLVCTDGTQNWFYSRAFSAPGKTEEDYADIYFSENYAMAKQTFWFADDNTKDVAGCYNRGQKTYQQLMEAVYLMRNIFFKDFSKLGCAIEYCPVEGPVIGCQYETNKTDDQMFSNRNFLEMCEKEPYWKSCDRNLDAACRQAWQNPKAPPRFPVEKTMMQLFNEKRQLAGLGTYFWDNNMQQMAQTALMRGCNRSFYQSNFMMLEYIKPTSQSIAMEDMIRDSFNSQYDRAVSTFQFKGEQSSKLSGCFSNQQMKNQQIRNSVDFVRNVFYQNYQRTGCAFSKCPPANYQNEIYVFGCMFEQPVSNQQLFLDQNFLQMCAVEQNMWQSCDQKLDQKCHFTPTTPCIPGDEACAWDVLDDLQGKLPTTIAVDAPGAPGGDEGTSFAGPVNHLFKSMTLSWLALSLLKQLR